MITIDDLIAQFYPVDPLDDGMVRCADELPRKTIHTWFQLSRADELVPLIVSDDRVDDVFATLVLNAARAEGAASLTKALCRPTPTASHTCCAFPMAIIRS